VIPRWTPEAVYEAASTVLIRLAIPDGLDPIDRKHQLNIKNSDSWKIVLAYGRIKDTK
jgi:hypothetical protein